MAVGPGGINYLPQRAPVRTPNGIPLTSPFAAQIQQLAAQASPVHGFVPPAPQLAPGTYTGAYAAQGLRTTDPGAAAQLWESRHPGAVQAGNIPGWVTQAMTAQMNGNENSAVSNNSVDVHARLNDAINHHRQANGLDAMHPEEIHRRVTDLAHEILGNRHNRLRSVLNTIIPPSVSPPSGPAGGPFVAS